MIRCLVLYEDGVIWLDDNFRVTDKDKATRKQVLRLVNGEWVKSTEVITPDGPNPFADIMDDESDDDFDDDITTA